MKKILPAILMVFVLALSSCSQVLDISAKPEDSRTVVRIGSTKINRDYYYYVFMNTWSDLCGGDMDLIYGDPVMQAELNDMVLETLSRNTAIEQLAKKHGVKLTSEEKELIKSRLDALKNDPESDYAESLKSNYMTEYTLEYVQSFEVLWGKVYSYVTDIGNGIVPCSGDDVKKSFSEDFGRIKYVMVSKDREDALDIARTVATLTDREEFEELIRQYNDDANMDALVDDGYYFIKGQIIPDVEEAVAEMETGQISPVIDTDIGYFIIKKFEPEQSYLDSNYKSVEEKYLAKQFNAMVDEIMDGFSIKYTALYREFTVFKTE
ncbi:MAG: peptidylprolyl isomerase [Clostridia bacterium]|nr:peptidylprolyl isomerase [Clostridia bacterium]